MNLKINIKRPQISKPEIAANKDFGELMKMYKASARRVVPFYRTTWFYAGMSAAAAVVVAIVIYVAPAANKTTYASLDTPMEDVNVNPAQYAVNAEQGGTIKSKSGSVINIPAKAFVTKQGKPVNGRVELTYRELKNPIDFFISGIPMQYESNGVNYAMESAGMIEIHASQKGEELDLAPDMAMDIALASHQSHKNFNLYKLDPAKKQWMLQGGEQDNNTVASNETEAPVEQATAATSVAVTSETLQNADAKLADIESRLWESKAAVRRMEASKPFEPEEEAKGQNRFGISVSNIKDFPEFAIYSDVMFRANEDNSFDKKAYNCGWERATLSKSNSGYVLTLKKEDMTASYSVRPVFEGEGYITAQNIYKAKIADYETALLELKAIEGDKQQQLAFMAEVVTESRKVETDRLSSGQGMQPAAASTPVNPGNLTFHAMKVSGCGIWGLNVPVEMPEGTSLTPYFTDEHGDELAFAEGKIYLVEKGRNVLFTFSDKSTITFDPGKECMIWGLTADNKIAVFRYEDFKTISKPSGDYIFAMQVSDMEMMDELQIEYFLNI